MDVALTTSIIFQSNNFQFSIFSPSFSSPDFQQSRRRPPPNATTGGKGEKGPIAV